MVERASSPSRRSFWTKDFMAEVQPWGSGAGGIFFVSVFLLGGGGSCDSGEGRDIRKMVIFLTEREKKRKKK